MWEVFGESDVSRMRAEYLGWVRLVAEERWLDRGLTELPWWQDADDAEEIVNPQRHREAETFDQQKLSEDRPYIDLGKIVEYFSRITGMKIPDICSRRRGPVLPNGRIDLTAIAVGRFGHRVCDVARVLEKNPGTVSRWLTMADQRSLEDADYRAHLDELDTKIAKHARPKVIK